MSMRVALRILAGALAVAIGLLVWRWGAAGSSRTPSAAVAQTPTRTSAGHAPATPIDKGPTNVYAHDLLLRKGSNFRIYIPWFRGQMVRTKPSVIPSFDDLDSFYLDVKAGVIHANIGDIGAFMNDSGAASHSPLKNMKLSGDGNLIHLKGTLHKFLIPIPIELVGQISAAPNDEIHIHVTKLNVLKIPFKGLLGAFHVQLSDLFNPKGSAGIRVKGNDIYLDTEKLLPPPHIRGALTSVRIVNPDLEIVFGKGKGEVNRVKQWRNFLRLRDGTLDFGKLTMHHVDIIMVDISKDAWFDLDLAHYQDQMVYGYTHMTPNAGLQIFMPDVDELPAKKAKTIGLQWVKHRNEAPPPGVYSK
ncbi:MAG TPA: hypothetical protein VF283_04460 [Bryobacteraceae bacterium]